MIPLELTGRLISLGDMNLEDFQALPDRAPRILLERPGGDFLLIAGLTRNECRRLAPAFAEQVSVTLTQVDHA